MVLHMLYKAVIYTLIYLFIGSFIAGLIKECWERRAGSDHLTSTGIIFILGYPLLLTIWIAANFGGAVRHIFNKLRG